MKYFIILSMCILFAINAICQINPSQNKISVDVSTNPQNASFDYDSCFTIGKQLGMTQTGIFQTWQSIETSPMYYNFTVLNIANLYYPAYGMAIDLTIAPIATNVLEVPTDLATTSFSSTIMINRFKKLLDSVKVHIPSVTLSSLIIGSESDVYFGTNTSKWADFTIFYNATSAYAKILWPGLKVSTELTFDGLINQNSAAQTLNTNSDYIGVSYYPLNIDFTMKPVTAIPTDFAALVALYPVKQLCFYQYGYASSTLCNSSLLQQKQFISQSFTSWDMYATHIKMIDFTWLHDLSPSQVSYYSAYYGISNPIFLEYLRTIGMRDWANRGTDKPALQELRCQAKVRGYNSLTITCSTTEVEKHSTVKNTFFIYPNPANETLSFKINFKKDAPIKLTLYNVFGELVKEILVSNESKISISDLQKGVYFIVDESNSYSNLKFIKE